MGGPALAHQKGGHMLFLDRRKPWLPGLLALGLWSGCGEAQAPVLGPNLIENGSFEAGLAGWWNVLNGEGGTVTPQSEAADLGNMGLVLHKSTGGWGTMVGQNTVHHRAGETFQFKARIKGLTGGERVTFNFHGEAFEVTAEPRWRTVSQMVLLPEVNGDNSALISLTTDEATVYVDEVEIAQAEVARGDADDEEDNLVHNGSFESGLGVWSFWTNDPEGAASTSPEARRSGYAGMVMTKGLGGTAVTVKQPLPEPLAAGETFRIEAHLRGTEGGELVNLCVQINDEPYDGPCMGVKAEKEWRHISRTLTIDPEIVDQRAGALVSLNSSGTVMLDDVVVVSNRGR
jgi:hypothetical protein